MTRTRPIVLLLAALVGGTVGFILDRILTAMAKPTFVPDVFLPIVLIVVAVAVLLLAWPVRRAKLDKTAPRVDPFRAMRTAVLARASSILGAAAGGFSAGLLLFVLTRPVAPQVGSVLVTAVTVGASIALVACALVAESFCSLPKDNDDDSHGTDGPTASSPA